MIIAADSNLRLQGLVKALTHQQIRELQSVIDEVDLHYDIIAKLPLEITQVILQYLPLYQIFQARRVSPEWRQALGSAQTVELLLRDWFPNHDVGQKLRIPQGLSAESVAIVKAKHIDAYRTGHAFSYARHGSTLLGASDRYAVAYADGVLGWVDYTESYQIKVIELKTGQEWSFLPEARTRINDVAVSSSMVTALGSGRCNVWTLHTGACHSLQLPSARGVVIAVAGESLAILDSAERHKTDPRVELITWTLGNQRTVSFFLALSSKKLGFKSQLRLVLDDKGQSLVLFESVHDRFEGRPVQFHYKRTSLDGDVIAQGSIDIADTRDYHDCSASVLPREANGQVVIWSFAKHQRSESDLSELMLICYNFRKDQLEVRRQTVKGLLMHAPEAFKLFIWKDTAYFLGKEGNNHLGLRVLDLHESTCSKAKMDFPDDNPRFAQRPQEGEALELGLLGDETFLVATFEESFCVWCFDANVRMSKEDIAYKEQRKGNIERRLEMKRARKHISSNESRTCT